MFQTSSVLEVEQAAQSKSQPRICEEMGYSLQEVGWVRTTEVAEAAVADLS